MTFPNGNDGGRPSFYIGQHDSNRWEALGDDQFAQVASSGFSFVTAPVTNRHFYERVKSLHRTFVEDTKTRDLTDAERANPSLPGPIVPTLTDEDTSLFPGVFSNTVVAYSSPWIDLYSEDPIVASISRQVLNIEAAYAGFCGVHSIIIPGPRADASGPRVAQYARAIQEALKLAQMTTFVIHMPMYREPGLEETIETLSGPDAFTQPSKGNQEIDIFSCWDTWHTIRSVCDYNQRLFVSLRLPKRLPEIELQTRWFAEPLLYLFFDISIFQKNRAAYPCLSKYHQDLVHKYMRLKNAPWLVLSNVGPSPIEQPTSPGSSGPASSTDFPSLAEAHSPTFPVKPPVAGNPYVSYLRYLERHQVPYTGLEAGLLTSFQDWLQSPLQPLADNLESATYEVFEGDPVKYDQYEKAIKAAMEDWKTFKRPMSASRNGVPELVVTVAGAGRGPLVTRVIRASEATGVPVQLWALEKNQNAYVYLLRMNKQVWKGKVHLVKTDMREWPGPVPEGSPEGAATTTVDILVSELLGSFGDNELSPECIDGVQRHIARPHGISIPHSYTAHLSPISYPRVHAELSKRVVGDPHAFETPWVVLLYAIDLVSQRVPGHPRFQQAWEFVHPVRLPFEEDWKAKHGSKKVQTGGGGAMTLSGGLNEHNTRQCHLTFVCRPLGVVHGLAGYFESVLYQPEGKGDEKKTPIEISTRPDQIDQKSKDMTSWFPIFFPLKKPLYFPNDSEIEVSMWRQTDDARVWYEWLVEAFVWTGPQSRVKVASSELHSSREVACMM